jgi:hypothetical protein
VERCEWEIATAVDIFCSLLGTGDSDRKVTDTVDDVDSVVVIADDVGVADEDDGKDGARSSVDGCC